MIRTPFYLPSGICLISDPVWVGTVECYTVEDVPRKYKYKLEIGTHCGIITETWSSADFLEGVRTNLIQEEHKQSMGPR